jgi:hypothetical protein
MRPPAQKQKNKRSRPFNGATTSSPDSDLSDESNFRQLVCSSPAPSSERRRLRCDILRLAPRRRSPESYPCSGRCTIRKVTVPLPPWCPRNGIVVWLPRRTRAVCRVGLRRRLRRKRNVGLETAGQEKKSDLSQNPPLHSRMHRPESVWELPGRGKSIRGASRSKAIYALPPAGELFILHPSLGWIRYSLSYCDRTALKTFDLLAPVRSGVRTGRCECAGFGMA